MFRVMKKRDKALSEAIRKAGSLKALANAIGDISPQAIWKWRRVPAERVIEVERATSIPRERLRPDLYVRYSASA